MTLEEIREVLGALSLAAERITELSGWCKLPASGDTLQAITDAQAIVSRAEKAAWDLVK